MSIAVAERVAGTLQTEFAQNGRQGENGRDRLTAVSIALEAPTAAQNRRVVQCIHLGKLFNVFGFHSGNFGGLFRGLLPGFFK